MENKKISYCDLDQLHKFLKKSEVEKLIKEYGGVNCGTCELNDGEKCMATGQVINDLENLCHDYEVRFGIYQNL
ncbi:MAG: hypothetical protein Q4F97_12825 [Bacteroidales bacterium]|nr:hypothetical protein [Bacteroidales bacterium]